MGVQWWHRAVVMKDPCIYVGVNSPSSRIKWVEPVAFPNVRTRWSFEVDGSLSIPCKHQCSCKDEDFHGQKWPSWSECEADLSLKAEMKTFLVGDKGWRSHAQAPDKIKSEPRSTSPLPHLRRQQFRHVVPVAKLHSTRKARCSEDPWLHDGGRSRSPSVLLCQPEI